VGIALSLRLDQEQRAKIKEQRGGLDNNLNDPQL
jgi:hypothetical protein